MLYTTKIHLHRAEIFQIDPLQPGEPPVMITMCPNGKISYPGYLVECDSEIMLVGYKGTSHAHMVVYRLEDLIAGSFIPVTSVRDHTLFLLERDLCVSSKVLPTILGNFIVCNLHQWLGSKSQTIESTSSAIPPN